MTLFTSGLVRVLTDPEAKYFESGSSVVRFYAGSYDGKTKDGEYINNAIEVQAWGKDGEIIINYCPKGSQVHIGGTLHMDEWIDKETGKKRNRHYLKAMRVELPPRSGVDENPPPTPAAAQPSPDSIPF